VSSAIVLISLPQVNIKFFEPINQKKLINKTYFLAKAEEATSTNTIILAVCIPLAVVVVAVIAFACYRKRRNRITKI
jgi:flagellar biosynthesis/type III secretory pathway M-ring protein FliF/YscJ